MKVILNSRQCQNRIKIIQSEYLLASGNFEFYVLQNASYNYHAVIFVNAIQGYKNNLPLCTISCVFFLLIKCFSKHSIGILLQLQN